MAEIPKSGAWLVEKVAVCTFSGTGVGVPFTIVTQRGGWLVGAVGEPQPVWKPSAVPELAAATL